MKRELKQLITNSSLKSYQKIIAPEFIKNIEAKYNSINNTY